jgi:hypothetical protein
LVEHASDAPRLPWWQDLRWITAGVVVVLLGLLAWGLFGPEPPLTVSRETTFLTAPLAADGLPDYGAAVLASLGPAPEPEDNAAVELLEVMWPLKIEAADLPAVCKALGILDVPPADPLRVPTEDAAAKVTAAMFNAAQERPWNGAEFPELAAWLVAHEAALDRLVAAADRPRYWLPDPVLLRPGPQWLFNFSFGHELQHQTAARLLVCRAMGHAGAGRHAAAWHDIRAVYRLGRLLAAPHKAPQNMCTHMLAIAIAGMANKAVTVCLLGAADLSADTLATVRRDLDALGPLPGRDAAVAWERLNGIDTLVRLARRTPGGREKVLEIMGSLCDLDPLLAAALHSSLDWDAGLRRLNAEYGRFEAAARLPTRAAQQAELDRLVETLRARISRSGWKNAGHALQGCCSRSYRSECVGDVLLGVFAPAFVPVFDRLTDSEASFDLVRTAAALAAWKADRGPGAPPYPERLDDLVPKYLAAVPLDPFSNKPFIYERRGEGYLVASVGSNGVYDGGDDLYGWIMGGEWQTSRTEMERKKSDFVVRMPVPPRPAPVASPSPAPPAAP